MDLYFDIGGTHFRYYLFDSSKNKIYESVSEHNTSDIISELNKCISNMNKEFNINTITVALPGIIKNNKIYGVNNLKLNDGTELIEKYNNILIKYINDGDAFVIGQSSKTLSNTQTLNILGIVFGTGVGSGLIINGQIVLNAEIQQILESFMKVNYLTEDNIDLVTTFIGNELEKLIKLLNLNYILIGGYVSNFKNFQSILQSKIKLSDFYNTQIIITHNSDNVILSGLQLYNYM